MCVYFFCECLECCCFEVVECGEVLGCCFEGYGGVGGDYMVCYGVGVYFDDEFCCGGDDFLMVCFRVVMMLFFVFYFVFLDICICMFVYLF